MDKLVSALARACEFADRAARWQLEGEHHFTTSSRLELASPINSRIRRSAHPHTSQARQGASLC